MADYTPTATPEDYLGVFPSYATPEMLKQNREYAQALLHGSGQQPVKHWTQGVSNMVAALVGGYDKAQAGKAEIASRAAVGRAQAGNPNVPDDRGGAAPTFTPAMGTAPNPVMPPGYNSDPATGGPLARPNAASVRHNNPGAQWPGPVASSYGATGSSTIGGGEKIASFDDPVKGAAAQFSLLDKNYTGRPLSDAIAVWSGAKPNDPKSMANARAYAAQVAAAAGVPPNTIITPEFLRSPAGIALAKSMAKWEAGGEYPLSNEGWSKAQALAFSGQPANDPQTAPDAPSAIVRALAPKAGAGAPGIPPVPGVPRPVGAPVGTPQSQVIQPQFVPNRPGLSRQQHEFLQGAGGPYQTEAERLLNAQRYYGQGQTIQMPIEGVGTVLVNPNNPRDQQLILTPHDKETKVGDVTVKEGFVRKPKPGGGYIDVPIEQEGGGGLRAPTTAPPGSNAPPPDLDTSLKYAPEPNMGPDGQPIPSEPRGMLATPPPGAPGPVTDAGPAAAPGQVLSDAGPIGGPGDQLAMNAPGADPNAPVAGPAPVGPDGQQAQLSDRVQDLVRWSDQRKRNNDYAQEQDKKGADALQKKYDLSQEAGRRAAQSRPQLEMARDIASGDKMIQGAGADWRLGIARLAELAKMDPQAAAATEVFNKIISGNVVEDMKILLQGLGQVRVAEIELLSKATANMYNTKEANKAVLDIMLRTHKQAEVLSQVGNSYMQGWVYDDKGKPSRLAGPPTNAGYDAEIQKAVKRMPVMSPEERHRYTKIFEADPAYNRERSAALEKQYDAWQRGDNTGPPPGSQPPPAGGGPATPTGPRLTPAEQEKERRLQGKT